MPKLGVYAEIKNKYGASKHVTANLNKCCHSLISQLRCGVLMIEIESGRFRHVPRDERTCKLCKTEIETAYHFLFHCKETSFIRDDFQKSMPDLLMPRMADRDAGQRGNSTRNCDSEILKRLSDQPFAFGNYINNLWQTRELLLTNETLK